MGNNVVPGTRACSIVDANDPRSLPVSHQLRLFRQISKVSCIGDWQVGSPLAAAGIFHCLHHSFDIATILTFHGIGCRMNIAVVTEVYFGLFWRMLSCRLRSTLIRCGACCFYFVRTNHQNLWDAATALVHCNAEISRCRDGWVSRHSMPARRCVGFRVVWLLWKFLAMHC